MPQSLIELQGRLAPPPPCGESEAHLPVEIGDQLKCMFDRLTTGPLPKGLLDLADALEEAFQRGELFDNSSTAPQGRAR